MLLAGFVGWGGNTLWMWYKSGWSFDAAEKLTAFALFIVTIVLSVGLIYLWEWATREKTP
jgi:membrane protein DedA with SNARE-associated domain